ncbi:Interleukin-20 [Bagarius yarrelli]|uniref:Interleukin-20 n=1 Tax=Bagarius yarrelli TaxID=175774 RepID=A0A556V8Z0_BAGYA|nr:Interleukin-20 [Bagarius yarrelli]
MKTSLAVCALLACILGSAVGRKLHIGSCALTVHIHELRHHFQQIRHNMVTRDNIKGVRLLKGETMKSLQVGDSCCFLWQLLRFYIEKVFSGYTSSQSLHQTTTSVLANSFLSMIRDLRACQAEMLCQCSQDANLKFDYIQLTFDEMDVAAASVKAIGELDSLLEWLESFRQKHHLDYDYSK